MARRRYLSTTTSTDKSVNGMARDFGDFAALMYLMMIPHADDHGAIYGEPEEIAGIVVPLRRDKSEQDIIAALDAMESLGLIEWDREADTIHFPENSFYKYQTYIKPQNRRGFSPNAAVHAAENIESEANGDERRKTPQNAASFPVPIPVSVPVSASASGAPQNAAPSPDPEAAAPLPASLLEISESEVSKIKPGELVRRFRAEFGETQDQYGKSYAILIQRKGESAGERPATPLIAHCIVHDWLPDIREMALKPPSKPADPPPMRLPTGDREAFMRREAERLRRAPGIESRSAGLPA